MPLTLTRRWFYQLGPWGLPAITLLLVHGSSHAPSPLPPPLSARERQYYPSLERFYTLQAAICVLHARRLVGAFTQTWEGCEPVVTRR